MVDPVVQADPASLASGLPRSLPVWRIFLSSTAVDLVAHRSAVADAILRLGDLPVRMETFGAVPNMPVAECEERVRESDAVVVLVAHRYGWIPAAEQGGRDGKSITWLEAEAALGAERPVFVFLVNEALPWTEAKEQDRLQQPGVLADPAKITEVARAVEALQRFKLWMKNQAGLVVDSFTTPDDLAKRVTGALARWAMERLVGGGFGARPAPTVRPPEFRVCHPLQPAPHFHGRAALVDDLTTWWNDPAHPDRVRALVAPGGTGKTAVVERLLQRVRGLEARGHILVWSFYQAPDADAFLREACDLFLNERKGSAGGRLERLERGLCEGNRPHLLVLDGLERLQSEARDYHSRGEIEDHRLRLLLRALAGGLGRARAIVTSRLQLSDLEPWRRAGYGAVRLDDLEPLAAVAVLRAWGVRGDDTRLGELAEDVGCHSLSVSVLASFLASFGEGEPNFADRLDLRRQAGDDVQAARLARILQGYASHLPAKERDLLVRLSEFPHGLTSRLLGIVVRAGGEIAGDLAGCDEFTLLVIARRLVERGLAFAYTRGAERMFTAHPFLRDWFRQLLGAQAASIHQAIRSALAPTLEARPGISPTDPAVLDRYETLIEHTRLAGQEREAIDLYWYGLYGYDQLAKTLGEYTRGARILAAFSSSGWPDAIAPSLSLRSRVVLLSDWALFVKDLGHLAKASQLFAVAEAWSRQVGDGSELSKVLLNVAELALLRGRLTEALKQATEALFHASGLADKIPCKNSYAYRAAAFHALGAVSKARVQFEAAREIEGEELVSLRGVWQTRHLVHLGYLDLAWRETEFNLEWSHRNRIFRDEARCQVTLSRLALEQHLEYVLPHLNAVRSWTAESGDMEMIVEAHWIAADLARRRGDLSGAQDEAVTGLNHSEASGYGLLQIELLVLLARIHLAWPDARAALQHALHALDLATAEECGYAWGHADAAHLCGEAHLALGEPEQARRRFEEALEVRTWIEHPAVAETQAALDRLGAG